MNKLYNFLLIYYEFNHRQKTNKNPQFLATDAFAYQRAFAIQKHNRD